MHSHPFALALVLAPRLIAIFAKEVEKDALTGPRCQSLGYGWVCISGSA